MTEHYFVQLYKNGDVDVLRVLIAVGVNLEPPLQVPRQESICIDHLVLPPLFSVAHNAENCFLILRDQLTDDSAIDLLNRLRKQLRRQTRDFFEQVFLLHEKFAFGIASEFFGRIFLELLQCLEFVLHFELLLV